MIHNRFNPSNEGLRSVLDPYGARGFRNLTRDEKNNMQMQYHNIANARGLSNNQRQQYLMAMKNQMAGYGLKPAFDLSSEKGLSQRQIIENNIAGAAIDRAARDNRARIAGANNMHNYNTEYMNKYLNSLLR